MAGGKPALREATSFLTEGNEVREEAIRSGHARGELPEKREAGVDVVAFAVLRHEHAAWQRRFAGIVHREDRREMILVPTAGEIRAALLHPTLKVFFGDAVGLKKKRMRGLEDFDRRLFDRYASLPAGIDRDRVWSKFIRGPLIVLNDQRTAPFHIFQQPSLLGPQLGMHAVGAHACDNDVELSQRPLL